MCPEPEKSIPGATVVVVFGAFVVVVFGFVVGDVPPPLLPNGFWSTNWITVSTWYAGLSGFASATTSAQWCVLSQYRWFLPNLFPLAGSVYFVSNSPFDCHCFKMTSEPSSFCPAQSFAPGLLMALPFASSSPQIVAATVPEPFGRWCALISTVWLYLRPVAFGRTCIDGLVDDAPSAAPPSIQPATASPATSVVTSSVRFCPWERMGRMRTPPVCARSVVVATNPLTDALRMGKALK